ncbi:unnamed protein product [Effrenium voratum]|nr:unnamed protein product [Effrenium voratum]
MAEEQSAESQGELEVSEARAASVGCRIGDGEKEEGGGWLTPVSFLQVDSEDDLAAVQKELAEVKAKIQEEQKEGQNSNRHLLEESRELVASQRRLSQLREHAKRLEREAKSKDGALLAAEKKLSGEHAAQAGARNANKPQALAMARKIGAARQEVRQLKADRQELLEKLRSQQEALDKVSLDIKRHSDSVAALKERSKNLEEMMANMDKADEKQLQKATSESQRIQSFFASMDKELQKARARKAELEQRAGAPRLALRQCRCQSVARAQPRKRVGGKGW